MKENFWLTSAKKLVRNLLSLKVWIIFALLITSTKLLVMGLMTGAEWAAVNGGTITTICAMREAFKVAKVKSDDNSEDIMI